MKFTIWLKQMKLQPVANKACKELDGIGGELQQQWHWVTGLRDGGKQIEERGQNKVHRKDNCTSVQLHVIISVFVSFAARGRHTFASSVALLYDKISLI